MAMPIVESLQIRPSSLRAVSRDGRRLGRVVEIRRSRATRMTWAVLRRGPVGRRRVVPLTAAAFEPDRVRVAFSAQHVGSAPRAPGGGIDAADDERLRRHYYGL